MSHTVSPSIVAGLLCSSLLLGCGSAVDTTVSETGDEDTLRISGRCAVAPDPVIEGQSLTVLGTEFPRSRQLLVRIDDAAGSHSTTLASDAAGNFTLTAAATRAGPGAVVVSTDSHHRNVRIASCAFAVVAPVPCGDGVCAADETCASCAADCPCVADEPGALSLASATYAVGEGDGAATVTIERLGGSTGEVTVEWRTLGATATYNEDYASFGWTVLTFADGERNKTTSIDIVADAVAEADETFTVLLRNPTGGATLGAITTTTVTIVDDDSDVVADPCAGITCSAHGSCAAVAGSASCVCDDGYHAASLDCLPDAPPPPAGQLPVFPGAVGPGTSTPAGRGGAILRVTSLADSGPGSLRAALSATGPRIVVFEVSGYIQLASILTVANPYVTIAGQTAPSPGICLRGNGLRIRTHDVLVQHLAIRSGAPEGLEILGPSSNVVVDHVSATWATDENMSTWYDDVTDVTYSHNLIAEGLLSHSMGLLLGAGFDRVALVGNVLAHNNGRNPRVQAGRTHDAALLMVNNLIYNHYWDCASISGSSSYTFPIHVNGVNNVVLDGAQTLPNEALYGFSSVPAGTTLYTSGDVHFAYRATTAGGIIYTGSPRVVTTSDFELTRYAVWSTAQVRSALAASVGARPADRDPQDQRILDSIAAGNGAWITSPDEVGGYTALAQNQRAFVAPANPDADSDGDGYTNVEEVLQQMAAALER